MAELKMEIQAAGDELDALNTQRTQMGDTLRGELEANEKIKELERLIAELRAEGDARQVSDAELQHVRTERDDAVRQVEANATDLQRTQNEVEAAVAKLAAAEAQLASLRDEHEAQESEQIAALQSELESLRSKLAASEEAHRSAQAAFDSEKKVGLASLKQSGLTEWAGTPGQAGRDRAGARRAGRPARSHEKCSGQKRLDPLSASSVSADRTELMIPGSAC